MRAVAVHRDAIVVTSLLWRTNAVAVRGPARVEEGAPGPGGMRLVHAGGAGGRAEAMLIDSPYFPEELDALPAVLGQAGFTIDALLATHADFDHVLGRLAFPDLALGVAETTAERLRAEPGAAQRELRESDESLYVERSAPLRLGAWQPLPTPGSLELGGVELELHPAEGHTSDGMAVFAPHAEVLACGDYLSGVEIPMISPGGSLHHYRGTLARLGALLERAAVIVPGHGPVHDRDTALRLLDEDVDYLDALEAGHERPALPKGRDTAWQRQIHGKNLAQVDVSRG